MNNLIARIRRTRRGSAIVAMTIFAVIIGFSVAALMSFAMARRRETARLVLYNADLAAAEHMLDRIVSTAFFVGQNSPRQYAGSADGVRNIITEMKDNTGAGIPDTEHAAPGAVDQYEDDVFAVQRLAWGSIPITEAEVAEYGQELAPWMGFNLQVEVYRLVAWARANEDSGIALASSAKRSGVFVSRNVTYFAVPLFNYAIFYENLFELDGGQRIDVYGKVHTNEDWYLTSSSEVWYHQNCTVAGRFFGGIYNPLDGARRSWYSGSTNINIAKTRAGNLGPADPASTFSKLYNTTLINYNKGYLSSYIYNPASPNGNPIFTPTNASEVPTKWEPRDYDSNGDGTIDDMNSDGDTLDYLDGQDKNWAKNPKWVDQSRSMFNDFLRDRAHGVDNVRMPIEEQNSPYLLIEPPDQVSLLDPADPRRQRPLTSSGTSVFLSGNGLDLDYKPLPGQTADDPATIVPRFDKFDVSLAYQAAVVLEPQAGWMSLTDAQFLARMTDADTSNDPVKAYRYELTLNPGNPSAPVTRTKVPFTKLWYATPAAPTTKIPFVERKRIYNGREGKYVNLLDINVTKMKDYVRYTTTAEGAFKLSNPSSDLGGVAVDDGIIYVYQPTGNVPAGEQAGSRLINAGDLNPLVTYGGINDYKGLTFATNGPMYTKGDVNKTNRIPLMIAGDSINILSNSFNDATYATGSGNGPNATPSATETNAVFVAGNVPTKYNQYGGGGENYFRYLENWGSGNTHKFRGSILNLFESRIAMASWDKDATTAVNSGYYGAPKRDWGWDPTYAAGAAPPGIPTARQMAIGRWEMIGAKDIEGVLDSGLPL